MNQKTQKWLTFVKLKANRYLMLNENWKNIMKLLHRFFFVSYVIKNSSIKHDSFFVLKIDNDYFLNFNFIMCFEFVEFLKLSKLHEFLSKWKTYLFFEKRIFLQMHFVNTQNWKIMLQFHDDVTIKTNCRVIEINDFFWNDVATKMNKTFYRVSIEKTINLIIKKIDFVEKQKMRRLIIKHHSLFDWMIFYDRRFKSMNKNNMMINDQKRQYFFVTLQRIDASNDLY